MLYMSDDEARAAGLYLVVGADGTPTANTPDETVARAGRMVADLAVMVRTALRDGMNGCALLPVREALGELHVDMDMLAEELTGWEFARVSVSGTVIDAGSISYRYPAVTAEEAAKVADELAAAVNSVLEAGFNRYRLNDVVLGLDVMADDFADLALTLQMHAANDRGAA